LDWELGSLIPKSLLVSTEVSSDPEAKKLGGSLTLAIEILKIIALNYPMVLAARRAIYTAVCTWSVVGEAARVGGTAYAGGTTYVMGVLLPGNSLVH
jgi:hypothetical protein